MKITEQVEFKSKYIEDDGMINFADCTQDSLDIIASDVLQHFGCIATLAQGQTAAIEGRYFEEETIKLRMARSDWSNVSALLKEKVADALSGKHLRKGGRITLRQVSMYDIGNSELFISLIVGFPARV